MNHRWRTLVDPELAGDPPAPRPREALAAWLLGTVWTLSCLWLGRFQIVSVAPAVLAGGLIALWGWRRDGWLAWLPLVVSVAALLDLVSPLPSDGPLGRLRYTELAVLGATLVALARALGLKRRPWPNTPLDRLIAALVSVFALALIPADGRPLAVERLKQCGVVVAVFYAVTALSSRPGGARWAWAAFPVAGALLGVHALWATSAGLGSLAAQAEVADRAWGSVHGLRNALLASAPVSVGLALDAGSDRARPLWRGASFLAVAGLALHAASGGFRVEPEAIARLNRPLEFSALLVAFAALLTLTRVAWQVRAHQPREVARWIALAGTFSGMALLDLTTRALSGETALLLLAIGGGATIGALRAQRRDERRAREAAPSMALEWRQAA